MQPIASPKPGKMQRGAQTHRQGTKTMELSIAELFAQAEEVGAKYQSQEERDRAKQELAELKAEIDLLIAEVEAE